MIQSVRTPLAWKNLTHSKRRLAAASCGIGFAVVLMFTETGFQHALFDSTVQVLEKLDADLIVASRGFNSLLSAERFSRRRLVQVRACPGVQAADPLYIDFYGPTWKGPGGKAHPIRLLAFDLDNPVLSIPAVAAARDALREDGTALFDLRSKPKYGLPAAPGEMLRQRGAELSGRAVRVAGIFPLGTDFFNEGNAITSAENFAKYRPDRAPGGDPLSLVDLGVVRVAPGADAAAVAARLREILPNDVAVETKRDFINREIAFWSDSTPIGYVFFLGMGIGFLVGVIVCYQVIYADVSDHAAEFATLKAMGYRNGYFLGLVLRESLYLSLLSFFPGALVSLVLYQGLVRWTGLLMALTISRAGLVLLLTMAMCVVSGCLAMRKVLAADPAELFR